ncbi:hypothetical protein PENTCL1PPCAC_292, partial [Pristionchus entomophagus]
NPKFTLISRDGPMRCGSTLPRPSVGRRARGRVVRKEGGHGRVRLGPQWSRATEIRQEEQRRIPIRRSPQGAHGHDRRIRRGALHLREASPLTRGFRRQSQQG